MFSLPSADRFAPLRTIVPFLAAAVLLNAIALAVALAGIADDAPAGTFGSRAVAAELIVAVACSMFALLLIAGSAAVMHFHRKTMEAQAHVIQVQDADAMTGLLNRIGFLNRVRRDMERRDGSALDAAMFYIDLDRFKEVNDTFGHEAGDELIRVAAERIREVAGPDAIVGRLGGDEFAVCIVDMSSREAAHDVATRLGTALARPCRFVDASVMAGASIGFALAHEDTDNVRDLVRFADLALYNAKQAGRGTHRSFELYMQMEVEQRREIERLLVDHRRRLELHFQPIVDTAGARLAGFEALLRLRTEEGRYISPATFIPVAEETGMIDEIGGWALHEACRVAALWPAHLKVAVNLSPVQFQDGGIVRRVGDALARSGLPASRLQLEITEGVVFRKTDDNTAQLMALKSLGVQLAMDDFGAGYCSLSYLWMFPFDTIKIDRCFVQALDDPDAPVASILHSILSLARSLRLSVTVEGVETLAQAAQIRAFGCDHLQGFLFGRPLPQVDVAAAILADGRGGLTVGAVAPGGEVDQASARRAG